MKKLFDVPNIVHDSLYNADRKKKGSFHFGESYGSIIMAVLLVIAGYILYFTLKIKEFSKKASEAKRRRTVNTYCRDGIAADSLSVSDVMKDWNGERKLFPNEVRGYLSENPKALCDYAQAIRLDTEVGKDNDIKCVFIARPYLCGFFRNYSKKIRVFNNTGVMYY